jgi:hypothetical protein
MENCVLEVVECLGFVFLKAKWNELEFEKSKWGDYCHFRDVCWVIWNLVISLFHVQFGKNC